MKCTLPTTVWRLSSKAAEVTPDGVLMDLDLPGITGDEAVCRIREQNKCKDPFLVENEKGLARRVKIGKTGSCSPALSGILE